MRRWAGINSIRQSNRVTHRLNMLSYMHRL